jgi:acyl transferase domain-containing protein
MGAAVGGSSDAPALADAAATLAWGRSHLVERLALVCASSDEARTGLAAVAAGELPAGAARARAASGSAPEIVFLFTGQGAQYPGMARQLFETQPIFRAAMQECDRIVSPLLGRPLLEVIFSQDDEATQLDDTAFTQPALFAVEYALARLWHSWGVEPTAVMGHSVGEYVAACVAGVFSLEDGLRLIAERGRLMSSLPRDGAMLAVFADEARVREALRGHEHALSIAATNGPQNTVIAGRTESIEAVRTAIGEGLARYINDAVVHVSIQEAAGNQVFVLGKVNRPGVYAFTKNLDVVQALSLAGGTSKFAETNDIKILRRVGGQQVAYGFRYADVEHGRGLEQNIVLQSGDVIVVP